MTWTPRRCALAGLVIVFVLLGAHTAAAIILVATLFLDYLGDVEDLEDLESEDEDDGEGLAW